MREIIDILDKLGYGHLDIFQYDKGKFSMGNLKINKFEENIHVASYASEGYKVATLSIMYRDLKNHPYYQKLLDYINSSGTKLGNLIGIGGDDVSVCEFVIFEYTDKITILFKIVGGSGITIEKKDFDEIFNFEIRDRKINSIFKK